MDVAAEAFRIVVVASVVSAAAPDRSASAAVVASVVSVAAAVAGAVAVSDVLVAADRLRAAEAAAQAEAMVMGKALSTKTAMVVSRVFPHRRRIPRLCCIGMDSSRELLSFVSRVPARTGLCGLTNSLLACENQYNKPDLFGCPAYCLRDFKCALRHAFACPVQRLVC